MFLQSDLRGFSNRDQQTKVVTLLSVLTASQLGETISSILERTGRRTVEHKKLLEDFKDLNSLRNEIIHSPWLIGWRQPGVDPPTVVKAFSPMDVRKTTASEAWDVRDITIEQIHAAETEAQRLQVAFHELLHLAQE